MSQKVECDAVHALFDGISCDGSIVNMGVKDPDGSVCRIIGVPESVRTGLNKHGGDVIHVIRGSGKRICQSIQKVR